MRYLNEIREGDSVTEIYLCIDKQVLKTRAGKNYISLKLQDKTLVCDAKIWDLNGGINDFKVGDYIKVDAMVVSFQGSIQFNIRRLRVANEEEFYPEDYIPSTIYDINDMYKEFLAYIDEIDDKWIKRLASDFFINDKEIASKFKIHTAAKSVHHNYYGGILEHTLGILRVCKSLADLYPTLNRALLYIGAMLHDIGKLKELSEFPIVEYTDEGQLIGHIVIGSEWVGEKVRGIEGFPKELELQIKHMILAHHGQLEFGSPKKPQLIEALILHYVDNIDAKIKMFEIIVGNSDSEQIWLGYNRLFESNLRKTDW